MCSMIDVYDGPPESAVPESAVLQSEEAQESEREHQVEDIGRLVKYRQSPLLVIKLFTPPLIRLEFFRNLLFSWIIVP